MLNHENKRTQSFLSLYGTKQYSHKTSTKNNITYNITKKNLTPTRPANKGQQVRTNSLDEAEHAIHLHLTKHNNGSLVGKAVVAAVWGSFLSARLVEGVGA